MKHKKTTGLFGIAAAVLLLLLYSCTAEGPCTGSLVLTNPIPDTTVAVGDTLFIDLANPPVFVSSEGRVTYATSVMQGHGNVDTDIRSNPNDEENFTLFLVIGKKEGEVTVELKSFSECLENNLTFNIIVTEQ